MSRLEKNEWTSVELEFFESFRELSEQKTYRRDVMQDPVQLSNPVCGDIARVEVELDQGRVTGFGYQQEGCWPVAGCLELLGRLCVGASGEEVLAFRLDEFLAMVKGVPASKRHAFSLTHQALLRSAARALAKERA